MLGHRQFADVVQHRRGAQRLLLLRGDPQVFGQLSRVHPHALEMVVRGLILRVNRQRQRFDGPKMQPGNFFGVFFLVFQTIEIQAIGAIDQVHHRSGDKHRLPADEAVGEARRLRQGGAAEIVGERPETALAPGRADFLVFR